MNNFEAHELVCSHVYKLHGDRSLSFMDARLKEWLAWFRKAIARPVYVNNYAWGGGKSQRGYRCNLCDLVQAKTKKKTVYASAHMRFQAVDFNVSGMSADEIRHWIAVHVDEMPCKIRIENDTQGWVHVDVANNTAWKITYFNG